MVSEVSITINAGRPNVLTSSSLATLKEDLSRETYNVKTEDFVKKLQKEHVKAVTTATRNASCSIDPVSRRSVGRYMGDLTLKIGNAEQTTDARAKATGDKINAISVAAAHFLMMPLSNPHITINADGISYQTGGGLTDKVSVIYDAEEQAVAVRTEGVQARPVEPGIVMLQRIASQLGRQVHRLLAAAE